MDTRRLQHVTVSGVSILFFGGLDTSESHIMTLALRAFVERLCRTPAHGLAPKRPWPSQPAQPAPPPGAPSSWSCRSWSACWNRSRTRNTGTFRVILGTGAGLTAAAAAAAESLLFLIIGIQGPALAPEHTIRQRYTVVRHRSSIRGEGRDCGELGCGTGGRASCVAVCRRELLLEIAN